jgi:hypothetical protein
MQTLLYQEIKRRDKNPLIVKFCRGMVFKKKGQSFGAKFVTHFVTSFHTKFLLNRKYNEL